MQAGACTGPGPVETRGHVIGETEDAEAAAEGVAVGAGVGVPGVVQRGTERGKGGKKEGKAEERMGRKEKTYGLPPDSWTAQSS